MGSVLLITLSGATVFLLPIEISGYPEAVDMEETVAVRSGVMMQPDSIEIAADASAAFNRLHVIELTKFLDDSNKHLSNRCAEPAIFI